MATIRKIDYDKERILVHYQQWSHRHDEWFQWSSPYLRPLERVSLRRLRLNPPCSEPVRHLHCVWKSTLTACQEHLYTNHLIENFWRVVLLSEHVEVFSVSALGVCFWYKGSGLLDRLSFLPSQNPQRQQRR